jgi:hypothetical protein
MDEYYFWLVDAAYFDPENQSVYTGIFDAQQNEYYDQNAQLATPWHDGRPTSRSPRMAARTYGETRLVPRP